MFISIFHINVAAITDEPDRTIKWFFKVHVLYFFKKSAQKMFTPGSTKVYKESKQITWYLPKQETITKTENRIPLITVFIYNIKITQFL